MKFVALVCLLQVGVFCLGEEPLEQSLDQHDVFAIVTDETNDQSQASDPCQSSLTAANEDCSGMRPPGTLDRIVATKLPSLPYKPQYIRVPLPAIHILAPPVQVTTSVVTKPMFQVTKMSSLSAILAAYIKNFMAQFRPVGCCQSPDPQPHCCSSFIPKAVDCCSSPTPQPHCCSSLIPQPVDCCGSPTPQAHCCPDVPRPVDCCQSPTPSPDCCSSMIIVPIFPKPVDCCSSPTPQPHCCSSLIPEPVDCCGSPTPQPHCCPDVHKPVDCCASSTPAPECCPTLIVQPPVIHKTHTNIETSVKITNAFVKPSTDCCSAPEPRVECCPSLHVARPPLPDSCCHSGKGTPVFPVRGSKLCICVPSMDSKNDQSDSREAEKEE